MSLPAHIKHKYALSLKMRLFCMLVMTNMVSCHKVNDHFVAGRENAIKPLMKQQGVVIGITPNQLFQLLKDDPNILPVDIRTEEELNGSLPKLKEAVHIENKVIFKHPDTLPYKKTVVIMCRSGHRSGKLARFLKDQGRTVYDLQGGLKNYYRWLKGLPHVEDDEIPETLQDIENEKGC